MVELLQFLYSMFAAVRVFEIRDHEIFCVGALCMMVSAQFHQASGVLPGVLPEVRSGLAARVLLVVLRGALPGILVGDLPGVSLGHVARFLPGDLPGI